jgi:hypothetical protein
MNESRIVAAALLLLLAGPARGETTAQDVLKCMRANVPAQLAISDLRLTVYDRGGGDRTLKGRLYSSRDEASGLMNATLQIDSPPEMKGAAYLVRETKDYLRDGMFVFLPAVRRVRRVSGTFADASLLGTNFSYFDFKQLQNAFGDLEGTLEAPGEVHGRPAHVLSFKPTEGMETRYTQVRAWIDQEACVGVRAEFLEGSRVAKELSSPAGALKKSGRTWHLTELEMKDSFSGTRTVLRMNKLDSDNPVPSRYFDATTFYMTQ